VAHCLGQPSKRVKRLVRAIKFVYTRTIPVIGFTSCTLITPAQLWGQTTVVTAVQQCTAVFDSFEGYLRS